MTKSEIEGYNDTESGGADLCLHRRVIKSRLVEKQFDEHMQTLEQFVLKERNIAVKPGRLEGLRVQPL